MKTGDVIDGRFVLGSVIGQGGMGVVFQATDLTNNQPVALKSLRALQADDTRRFLREAEVLEGLMHPGVVRYVKHGRSEEGELYLAMEWLRGEDLSKRILRAALSLDETLSLMRSLAETLKFAHERRVIHRDIKPQNIFLCDAGEHRVKLLDFGIARLGSAFSDVTATGILMGTPGYLAPEQAVTGAKGLEASADIFSLGCVFYECFAGRMPFVGDNILVVLSKILLAGAPKIRQLRPDLPQSVEDLIAEMLEKEPHKRPPDGGAVLQRLNALSMSVSPVRAVERPSAITQGEQRLLCVLLLARSEALSAFVASHQGSDDATVAHGVPTAQSEVIAFGGRFDALIDGSGLVTFAAVGSATDLASQAARCALALQRKIPGTIAIATGRGEISQTLPAGEVIDRANALLQATTSDGALASGESAVWMDESTAGLIQQQFVLTRSERGFRLHKEGDLAEPVRTLLGRVLPCVGRERELATLETIARECIDERSLKVAVVTAAAGVGKSRLRQELLGNLKQRGLHFERLLCRAEPLRARSPYSLIGNAIRYAAGIQDNDPVELQQQKLTARVGRNVAAQDVGRVCDFLAELAGLRHTREPCELFRSARRSTQVMAAQLQKHLEEFLQAELDKSPVLLMLEDLHWADAATVRILDGVMRNLAERPLFVFGLARPEVHATFPELWSSHGVDAMGLSALNKKNAERLIRQALPTVSGERLQELTDISQGNAFYLEELCRATAEGRGALPTTVLAMTSARLESLDAEDRRLLRAASVFGEAFCLGGVRALLGDEARGDCSRRLQALQDRELVHQRPDSRVAGEDEYAFRHALLREAAYSMLTEDDKRLAHQLAGEWLAAGRELDPLVLAKHFELGGDRGQSLRFYTQAAKKARGSATPETVALYEKVLALGAEGEARGEVLAQLAEIYLLQSDFERIMTVGSNALELLPKENLERYRLLTSMWGFQAVVSPDEILAPLGEVIAEPFAGGDRGAAQMLLWSTLCFYLGLAGLCHEVRGMHARVLENEAYFRDDPLITGYALFAKGSVEFLLDADPWAARTHFEKAAQIGASLSDEILFHTSDFQALSSDALLGDFEPSLKRLDEALEQLRGVMQDASYIVRILQIFCLNGLGRFAEGLSIAEEIAPTVARLNPIDEKLLCALQSSALLAEGDVSRAVEFAERAMASPHPARSIAQSALAEARLARGEIEEAVAITRTKERELRSLDVRPILFGNVATTVKVLVAAGLQSDADDALKQIVELVHTRASAITDSRLRQCYLDRPDHRYLLALAKERSVGAT